MDTNLLLIVIAVILDGIVGLSGGILPAQFVHRHIATLLSFAAGTLIGVTFFDLLPQALTTSISPHQIMYACLAGFVFFYVIESFVGSHAAGQGGHKHTVGSMILLGDALHNATDGVALAAAFMTDVRTGLATTLAVLVHELPQEIGDFTILVAHGYSRSRALLSLFLVQLAALLGAFGAVWAAKATVAATPFLLAASAGGFIYIAAANLIPELKKQDQSGGAAIKLLAFCGGLATIGALQTFVK